MPAPRKYPNELRERAQRLVVEAREQEPELSLTAAVNRIGPRVGVQPDTLRGWFKRADVDAGRAPGTTTSDAAKLKELEREVRELKRANEILLAASSGCWRSDEDTGRLTGHEQDHCSGYVPCIGRDRGAIGSDGAHGELAA